MSTQIQSGRYDGVSQVLHWTTALLVLVLLVMGKAGLVDVDHPGSAAFMWHGSLGVLVLALVGARVLWRLVRPPPQLPATMTRSGRIVARSLHVALYALLVALPLSGWLAASSEGGTVNLFNLASLPRLQISGPTGNEPGPAQARAAAGENEDFAEELHELLGDALIILASLHVLAAFKHQFIDRDGLIRRMLPSGRPKSAGVGPLR